MAFLEDIQNTVIEYNGVTLKKYPVLAFNYHLKEFDFMIHIRLILNKNTKSYSHIYDNRGIGEHIISTGDVRWILKKLYND
jgi:hypothetical protein